MRVPLLVALASIGTVAANYRGVEVYPGNDTGISLYGNWTTVSDNCGSAFVTSTVGDSLAYSFQGAAVYVFGTVACGWPGLINLSVDGTFNTTINRCNCDVVPAGGPGYICRYPWLEQHGLDPSVLHTLTVSLVGPTLKDNPNGNVIAELRAIKYLVPLQSSSTVDDSNSTSDDPTSTYTSVINFPTTTPENADAPLPQLASLHLSTAATCGIIIAVVIFFLLALLACILLRRRSHQKRRQRANSMIQQTQSPSGSRPVSIAGVGRYPTEHLAWSPAAERLEARAQRAASVPASKRNSSGSVGRQSWRRTRMDSIPEAVDSEHDPHAASAKTGEEKREGFVWSAVRAPAPVVPAGEYWNRRTASGVGGAASARSSWSGASGRLPQSPLRRSIVPGDD